MFVPVLVGARPQLPGRTDNEIKNYWNTRTKRRQRAGLPVYPPEVQLHLAHSKRSRYDQCPGASALLGAVVPMGEAVRPERAVESAIKP